MIDMPKSILRQIMCQSIPDITNQKKNPYRPSYKEIKYFFHILNREIFNNELPLPKFILLQKSHNLGVCKAYYHDDNHDSKCLIKLKNKWYTKQWLIVILAHEMCHQYQWDVLGKCRIKNNKQPLMSHGPTFFMFAKKLEKFGIPLRRKYKLFNWFAYQNLFKC